MLGFWTYSECGEYTAPRYFFFLVYSTVTLFGSLPFCCFHFACLIGCFGAMPGNVQGLLLSLLPGIGFARKIIWDSRDQTWVNWCMPYLLTFCTIIWLPLISNCPLNRSCDLDPPAEMKVAGSSPTFSKQQRQSQERLSSTKADLAQQSLISSDDWLQLHGLKSNKLTLNQILSHIGFPHCEGTVFANSVAGKYNILLIALETSSLKGSTEPQRSDVDLTSHREW